MVADRTPRSEQTAALSGGAALTKRDMAVLLKCSVKTVSRLAGEIPGRFRVGRLVRFERTAVLDWIRAGAPTAR